ncbi:MAG: hypothetical protein ABW175_25080 [Bradyrhizobium sp.]
MAATPSIRTNRDGRWKLLILLLPPLQSLAGQGGMPKLICLLTGGVALLLSFGPHRAVVPAMLLWAIGMAIAARSLRERIHQLRAAGVRQLK